MRISILLLVFVGLGTIAEAQETPLRSRWSVSVGTSIATNLSGRTNFSSESFSFAQPVLGQQVHLWHQQSMGARWLMKNGVGITRHIGMAPKVNWPSPVTFPYDLQFQMRMVDLEFPMHFEFHRRGNASRGLFFTMGVSPTIALARSRYGKFRFAGHSNSTISKQPMTDQDTYRAVNISGTIGVGYQWKMRGRIAYAEVRPSAQVFEMESKYNSIWRGVRLGTLNLTVGCHLGKKEAK